MDVFKISPNLCGDWGTLLKFLSVEASCVCGTGIFILQLGDDKKSGYHIIHIPLAQISNLHPFLPLVFIYWIHSWQPVISSAPMSFWQQEGVKTNPIPVVVTLAKPDGLVCAFCHNTLSLELLQFSVQ